jgi:hypothetical protein
MLFLAQAAVALLLSYFMVTGWLGLIVFIVAVVAGMLLGSCFEMIGQGSNRGFLPRKWETRGALLGGIAAVCGGWVHPEAAAIVAMIAFGISLFLSGAVIVVVGIAEALRSLLDWAKRDRRRSSATPTGPTATRPTGDAGAMAEMPPGESQDRTS